LEPRPAVPREEHQGRLCSKEQIFAGWAESCDLAKCLSKLAAMNLEVNVKRWQHYYRLSNDKVKVKQWASTKVNAVLRFKWNDLDLGTQFTCFTGTRVQILKQLGEQRGGRKRAAASLPGSEASNDTPPKNKGAARCRQDAWRSRPRHICCCSSRRLFAGVVG
jgi:hypothetical protein